MYMCVHACVCVLEYGLLIWRAWRRGLITHPLGFEQTVITFWTTPWVEVNVRKPL